MATTSPVDEPADAGAVAVDESAVAASFDCEAAKDPPGERPRLCFAVRGRKRGLLFAFACIIFVSPDAVLTRTLRVAGDEPSIFACIAIKYTFAAAMQLVICGFVIGPRHMVSGLRAAPLHLLLAGCFQALVSWGFTVSFLETSAALALTFISLNPLWAALLGCVLLKERLPPRTVVALAAALGAVALVLAPSLVAGEQDEHTGEGGRVTHVGNALALATGLFLAGYLTAARWTAMRRPAACGQHAMTIGSLCAAVAGFIVALAVDGPAAFDRPPAFYGYAALNGLSISAAYVSLGFAPKHARGAEISMVLLLEVVLGPIWMFLGYGDRPAVFTLVGGALLLLVLFLHELAALRDWLSDWRSCLTGSRERNSADGPVLTETK